MPILSRLKLKKPTVMEWLICIVMIAIVIALVVPAQQWAGNGTLRIPVHVLVFDFSTGEAIEGARVSIVRASPPTSADVIRQYPQRFSAASENASQTESTNITGEDGTVVIDHEFRTGASHRSPDFRAHLQGEWVVVAAPGYPSVTVQVRPEPQLTRELRKQGKIDMTIGLKPSQ